MSSIKRFEYDSEYSESDDGNENIRKDEKYIDRRREKANLGFTNARSWQGASPSRLNESQNTQHELSATNEEKKFKPKNKIVVEEGKSNFDDRENQFNNTRESSSKIMIDRKSESDDKYVPLLKRGDLGDASELDLIAKEDEEEYEIKTKQSTIIGSESDEKVVVAEEKFDSKNSEESLTDKGTFENSKIPFISVAHRGWMGKEHVQCTIIRDRSSMTSKMYPTYELILEGSEKLLLVGKKMNMNTTSNYHIFDMTRGTPGSKLNKKSANFVGKLRALDTSRSNYVVVTSSIYREEVAGINFERPGMVKHLKDGSQPRKISVVVPPIDSNRVPVPNIVTGDSSLIDNLHDTSKTNSSEKCHFYYSKEPVFENGNYRLNFRGRVSVPSVKNFQLVPEQDIDDIVLQFGKVADDRFHLDFKAPLNAFQAFCLALCQFNL